MKHSKNLLALVTIFTGISILACWLSTYWGIYLGEYEVFFSYGVLHAAIESSNIVVASSDNFLLYPIYTWLQKLTSYIQMYGVVKMTISYLAIGLVLFSIVKSKELNRINKFFLSLIFLLLFLESFFFIQNVRIGTLLSIGAFVYLLTFKNDKIVHKLVFYVLIFLAITNRIQIAVILSLLSVFFVLIYFRTALFRHTFLFFILSILSYITFLLLANMDLDHSKNYVNYERDFYDKMNVTVSGSPLDSNIERQNIKKYARILFIEDGEALDSIEYTSLLKHKTLYSYIFKNTDFTRIYISKISQAYQELKSRYLPMLFLFVWLLGNLLLFDKQKRIKHLLSLLLFTGLFAFINLVAVLYADVIYSFLGFFIFIFILYINQSKVFGKSLLINTISSLLLLLQFSVYSTNLLNELKLKDLNYHLIENEILEDKEQGVKSIVSYLSYQEIMSPNIFKSHYILLDQLTFLDFGTLNGIPMFSKERSKLFGKENQSLAHRIDWVIENNQGILYSDDFFSAFYPLYLQKVYDVNVNFEPIQAFDGCEIKKYKISYQTNKNKSPQDVLCN